MVDANGNIEFNPRHYPDELLPLARNLQNQSNQTPRNLFHHLIYKEYVYPNVPRMGVPDNVLEFFNANPLIRGRVDREVSNWAFDDIYEQSDTILYFYLLFDSNEIALFLWFHL
jgi:hypothetical protein